MVGTLEELAMTTRQPLYKSLYVQVIVAITIGILLGHFYPETGVALKPLGDGFVKLIKMVIAPIIFCTVVSGIAGMQNMKSVGISFVNIYNHKYNYKYNHKYNLLQYNY